MFNKWNFNEKPNVMAITTKKIINRQAPILLVTHDLDDGMWQFHDSFEVNIESAALVSLQEIVNIDSSLNELSKLPLGWYAWRNDRNDSWKSQRQDS